MPRTDPITGCTVMTTGEFWAAEAEHEGLGRTGADLQADFWEDWARVEEEDRQRFFDPNYCLSWLRSQVEACSDPEEPEPIPVRVVCVAWVNLSASLSSTAIQVLAQVLTSGPLGPEVRWLLADYRSWAGTRLDPPDYDSWISWIPLVG